MSKQCLSIEQMQHLKELGVDTKTASLCWVCLNSEPYISFYNKGYPQDDEKVIPSFTLQDILDLLPQNVLDSFLTIIKDEYLVDGRFFYNVCYQDALSDYELIAIRKDDLIDAAYEMLCWVIENGYLKVK